MPQINGQVSVAANAIIANQLAGSVFEFSPTDAFVEFGVVAAAVGINASVITGTDILMDDQGVSFANRFPVYPDDFTLNDAVGRGERLILKLRNTTGVAILVNYSVKLTPLAPAAMA